MRMFIPAALMVALSHFYHVHGSPASATDNYVSLCGFVRYPVEIPAPPTSPSPPQIPPPHPISPSNPPLVPSPPQIPLPQPISLSNPPLAPSPPQISPRQPISLSNPPLPPSPPQIPPPHPISLSNPPLPPSPPSGNCGNSSRPPIFPNGNCGAIVPGFSYQASSYLSGGDILQVTYSKSSVLSCSYSCLNLTGCVGFSQNVTDGSCNFKNASAVSTYSIQWDSWLLCSTPAYSPRSSRRLLQSTETGPFMWSQSSTWPDGIVPGVGSAIGANATIPCGKTVILDVPSLTLGLLRIQGLLQFLDDPSLPQIYVKANYVLVEGQLFIGTPSQQFRQKATIELTPNTNFNRAPLLYTYAPPAEPAYPRSLGHKAFAVVRGQVRLHGLPGPSDMPVWVKLSRSAPQDETTIQVDSDVSGQWPIGGLIAVASSDYDLAQSETFTIVDIKSTGTGESIITLDQPLVYDHYGEANGLSDGFGGFIDERSEVALISRNIVIMGTDEPAPYELEGGHFIVFMTNYPPQYIEGVQFYKMGQQGTLGRYSIHFHIIGSVPGTLCRKNSIYMSKQRCIVVHASHNITLDSNVAFNTSGHCFMLEEGGETGNTFINNIGMMTKAVTKLISSDETDDRPSTFWITNPVNKIIGNVAAGSKDSGFWFELRGKVRGNSLSIPSINGTTPIYLTIDIFANNTAHSNTIHGLRTYPNGMLPTILPAWTDGPINIMSGLTTFKNGYNGMFLHHTDLLIIENAVIADNLWGVHLDVDQRVNIRNSRIIALTDNIGNAYGCWDASPTGKCMPAVINQCSMPLQWGVPGRSTGGPPRSASRFGIMVNQGEAITRNAHKFENISFANYDPTCYTSAAFGLIGSNRFANPGHTVEKVKFTSNTQPVFIAKRLSVTSQWSFLPTDGGEQSMFYALYDKDGSVGGSPGYIVANTTQILPPGLAGCTPKPTWNAYSCSGVCYRSLLVSYTEPSFIPIIGNNRSMFSYLQVIRLSDGQKLLLDGNLQGVDARNTGGTRQYFMTLLANQVYSIEIIPSALKPSFLPTNISFTYSDPGNCGQGFAIRFKHIVGKPWRIQSSSLTYPALCPGMVPFMLTVPYAQYTSVCVNEQSWLEISLGPKLSTQVTLLPGMSTDTGNCSTITQCSLQWSGKTWLYDDSGLERRPSFYNPILSQPSNWKNGTAVIGYTNWNSYTITTQIAGPNSARVTYYYRNTFNLSYSPCYTSLSINIIVEDGFILYINNREALRVNLPNGTISNKTTAPSILSLINWQSYVIPISSESNFSLVDGINTIAIEKHMGSTTAYQAAFDMRISASKLNSCTSSQAAKPEICDGLDNNLDGLIDIGPDGKLLTIPCATPCGSGIMTCIDGYFQQCTAVTPTEEVCDGRDNNCDGLVDNGPSQLNCGNGSACLSGKCLPVYNATIPTQIWPQNSTGWSYYDKGGDLDSINPIWRTGTNSSTWPIGAGPLGFDFSSPAYAWQWFGTRINNFLSDRKSLTAYFAKNFTLTQSDINTTFNIDFSVRRVDGVVVYLNGVEVWRSSMNWGPIKFNTSVTTYANPQWTYNPCSNCRRNNTALLKVGTNYITAELHVGDVFRKTAAFDMDLYRNRIVPCSYFPGSPSQCIRQVGRFIVEPNSVWKYSDGLLSVPPSNWMTDSYNDSSWSSGIAPLGYGTAYGSSIIKTFINNGTNGTLGANGTSVAQKTFYFRKFITVPDSSCYFKLSASLLSKDGVVIYINGVEAIRNNLPSGPMNSTVVASWTGIWNYLPPRDLSGGWLISNGTNLIAVELHRAANSLGVVFDIQLSGSREGLSCGSDLTLFSIPWAN